MAEETVLFRVTRERTTIFHPDRSVSLKPIMTGGEIMLPQSVAEYHVRNGVGEIVTGKEAATPEKAPEAAPEAEKAPARRPGRPAKTQ